MEHFIEHYEIDINLVNETELSEIRMACEKAKLDLSSNEETQITVYDKR